MKKILLALSAAALPLSAFAEATVEWVNPKDYRDAYATSMESDKSRQIILDNLEKYIKEQADRFLKDGQKLSLHVTDLDLAGEYERWRGPDLGDTRIVKSPYFAFVKFDFKLEDKNGNVIREGQETLRHFLDVRLSLANRDEQAPYVRDLMSDFIRSLSHEAARAEKANNTASNN